MEDKQTWYAVQMKTNELGELLFVKWGSVEQVMTFASEQEAADGREKGARLTSYTKLPLPR